MPAKVLDTGTSLALERTLMAGDRTLMSWIRTAASLISFGFTIYKFFEFEITKGEHLSGAWISPREFGVIMIGTGLASLVLGTIDHRRHIKRLHAEYGTPGSSKAGIVAAIVALMGLVAFAAAAFRW